MGLEEMNSELKSPINSNQLFNSLVNFLEHMLSEPFNENNLILGKKRRIIPEKISGNNWRPLKKYAKRIKKMELETETQLIEFLMIYTELYNILEDGLVLRLVDFLRYGNLKSILDLISIILKTGIHTLSLRKNTFQKIYQATYFKESFNSESNMEQDITQNIKENYRISRMYKILEKENKFKMNAIGLALEYITVMRYTQFVGKEQVKIDGKKTTFHKAILKLKEDNRNSREKAWRDIYSQLLKDSKKFNKLFQNLFNKRIKQSKKAGYDNCRDYFHDFKGRFDYTPADCIKFHDSIYEVVVPIVKEWNSQRKQLLGVDELRPWDMNAPLMSADKKVSTKLNYSNEELLNRLIKAYHNIHPAYGKILEYMVSNQLLDIDNRRGKMSGAMCLPLADHHSGFIIANNIGSFKDITTCAHEAGHGLHWHATASMSTAIFRDILLFPMELAELASMTMELLVMTQLDLFYEDKKVILQTQKEIFEDIIRFFPWCAMVDGFQHWLYTHPKHTIEERMQQWGNLVEKYRGSTGVNYNGIEKEIQTSWFRQGHIFQSPFYYIEYGIAQLGAIGIYRNYLKNPKKTIEQFNDFMKLGNSCSLNEAYKTAGIKFSFDSDYLRELMDFILKEIENIEKKLSQL